MKLSILIPTIYERRDMLNKLLEHLFRQKTDEVEILWLGDGRTMGLSEKQNKLLLASKGDYVGFLDDDDWTADDYIERILRGIQHAPDVVSVDMLYSQDGGPQVPVHVSIHNEKFLDHPPQYFKRWPSDKAFVKREHALKTMLNENLKMGMDTDYALRIRPLLKTEYRVTKPVYYYNYSTKLTTTKG